MSLSRNKILKKNCLFICFADHNIGVGHLFRSQILAKSSKNSGWNNFLFGPNIAQKKIVKKNLFKKIFYLNSIDKDKILSKVNNDISEIINKNEINLVIIDSYLIDNKFQKKLRDKLVLKISNKKRDNKYCDLILDYSFNLNLPNKSSKYLIGPKFCLIESKIKKIKKHISKKILITYGGSDLLKEFENTFQVLKKYLPNYKVFVSTPSPFVYGKLKKKLVGPEVILSTNLSKIITKYNFDFIISSAGHLMYELIANNYPSIFVGMFKNQNINIDYLKKTHGAKVLKYNNYSFNKELIKYIRKYKTNNKIFDINRDISSKINFNGSDEVIKILDLKFNQKLINKLPVLYTKRLKLIPLSKNNILKLYFLRKKIMMNKDVFKEKNLFSKLKHIKWFKNYIKKNRIDYLIFEKKFKEFIGSLHFKIKEDELEIGKYISNPQFLGKNYGIEATRKWMKFGIKQLGYNKIIAITSKKNVINISLNKKLGFKTTNKKNKWQKMIFNLR